LRILEFKLVFIWEFVFEFLGFFGCFSNKDDFLGLRFFETDVSLFELLNFSTFFINLEVAQYLLEEFLSAGDRFFGILNIFLTILYFLIK